MKTPPPSTTLKTQVIGTARVKNYRKAKDTRQCKCLNDQIITSIFFIKKQYITAYIMVGLQSRRHIPHNRLSSNYTNHYVCSHLPKQLQSMSRVGVLHTMRHSSTLRTPHLHAALTCPISPDSICIVHLPAGKSVRRMTSTSTGERRPSRAGPGGLCTAPGNAHGIVNDL